MLGLISARSLTLLFTHHGISLWEKPKTHFGRGSLKPGVHLASLISAAVTLLLTHHCAVMEKPESLFGQESPDGGAIYLKMISARCMLAVFTQLAPWNAEHTLGQGSEMIKCASICQ
jgi:hypothetical protein